MRSPLPLFALLAAFCLPAAAADAPRNLLIVSIDTLRADRLGCYGNARPTSPAIDAIAAGGVRFEDASATSPWTKPSHASLFTGLYPSRHGADTKTATLAPGARTLAEILREAGYRTAALVNASWFTKHGMKRGFAEFDWVPYVQGRREGSAMTDRALSWFGRRAGDERPFFLFLHYMDVHSDYTSLRRFEKPFVEDGYEGKVDGTTQQLYRYLEGRFEIDEAGRERLLQLYDAGIRQVDDGIGRLWAYLEERGLLEDTLVVLTSDHGEEFLEHRGVSHGYTQYQEVLRVPLIFSGPGVPAAVVRAPVSLVDVAPTVLTLLGRPLPDGLDGRPLGWSEPQRDERALYMEADTVFPPSDANRAVSGPTRALRQGRFKLLYHREAERFMLFDLRQDPGETKNVAAEQPEVAERMLRELRCFLELTPDSPPCR